MTTSWRQNRSLCALCDKLVAWITQPCNIDRVLIPFILHDQYVSKRLLYWTVSKYAQIKNITILQSTCVTNVYEQYSNHLRTYNRRLFDVFCRQPYLLDLDFVVPFDQWRQIHDYLRDIPEVCQQQMFEYVGARCVVRTTLGQLNFFHWAHKDGILAYVKTYGDKLMAAMKDDSRQRRETKSNNNKKHRQHIKRNRPINELILLYRPRSVQV